MIPRSLRMAGSFVWALAAAVAAAPGAARAAGPEPPLDVTYREAAARLIGAALTSDRAYERLHALCDGIGHRLSGSPGLERAVKWAADEMRSDGLDRVELQPVMVPHWVRGEERAEMVAPYAHPIAMLGLGRSVGTPRGGITADVVVVSSFEELAALPASEVRGRIVLYDVPFTTYGQTVAYRGDGANRAAARGAVGMLLRSVGPVSLRTPHTGAMRAYVDSIPKIPAAAISVEDAELIHRLTARGTRVRVRLEMGARTLPDAMSHNVIGELRGRERPDEVVVVSGHLDSWDVGQGAHDDGGGCVLAMEAVRLLKELDLRPRRTVRAVLFTNEENGRRGGDVYADSAVNARARHVAAIESDGGVERPMGFGVRYLVPGTETADTARTRRAAARAREIARLLAPVGAGRVTESGGGTDIEPLMRRGVLGVSHETVMERYFHWHHTHSDMLDKVDPAELRRNLAAIAVMTYILADLPDELDGGSAP